jgi:hypothetical protein
VAAAGLMLACTAGPAVEPRGGQFISFRTFSSFQPTQGAHAGETVLESPVITSPMAGDEVVASWNALTPEAAYLKIEVRAWYPNRATKYYAMGLWSANTNRYPRASVPGQKDEAGDVSTDTLILKQASERLQIRVTLGGDKGQQPKLKFLSLCLTDTKAKPRALPPNRAAWGKTLPVPERSQMAYPNGKVLCSPTTVSMIMTYWAQTLKRPELDHDVPDIVRAIYDPQFQGTGNWPFNTAYAGAYEGMTAYVTRLSDLSEVEDWIAAGVPLALSVCSDRLHHRGAGPNGHLIVCAGFTRDGDPVVNDPGSSRNIRRVYPRQDLIYAWASSRNAVYILYPEKARIPRDRFGHWALSSR